MTEFVRFRPLRSVIESWPLLLAAVFLTLVGILTMHPFGGSETSLAPRQLSWLGVGIVVYIILAMIDMRMLRRTSVIVAGYLTAIALLILVLIFSHPVQGAQSWFFLGGFSFQPADLAKIALIGFLAKYFSRRHMEIAHLRHIIVSGLYAAGLVFLLLLQPDLGTAAIFSAVWFGIILVSGISKKHLALALVLGVVGATSLWFLGLHDYQRERIVAFLNPAADITGSGYSAYQAVVAVGSGELFGKGVGYGTQSKLQFLPEYETDFIFAAFAEEWGFVGIILILGAYGLLLVNLILIARRAATNFDAFFTLGVAILFFAHMTIHVGINLGLLPVTGTTIPFMSYGGSHLLMEFACLGIVASLAHEGRTVPRTAAGQEYVG